MNQAIEWIPTHQPSTLGVELPSGRSASDFIEGVPGSTGRLVAHFAGRAALIAVGLYLVGVRDWKTLGKYSLASSAAIEAFVLGYAWYYKDQP